jgi:hypothetical protein
LARAGQGSSAAPHGERDAADFVLVISDVVQAACATVERWQRPAEFAERPDRSVAPLVDDDLAAFLAALDDLPTIDR